MIVEKKYCRKCGYETLHRCSKPDFWSCIRCNNSIIEKFDINESEIDTQNPSYFLYARDGFVFFYDMVSANVTTKIEIKKLLSNEILRIPMYRVKK